MRSKQWYTKASMLPNSFAKVSISRLPLFLPQQQDHRADGRWKSKRRRDWERKERVQGKETAGFVPLLSNTEDRSPDRNQRMLGVFNISNIFG
jgi:hypothetical protein